MLRSVSAALFAVVALSFAGNATAAPYTSFSGLFSSVESNSTGGALLKGSVVSASMPSGGPIVGASVSDIQLAPSAFTGPLTGSPNPPPPPPYTYSGTMLPVITANQLIITSGTDTAVFLISNPLIGNITQPPGVSVSTAGFSGTATLISSNILGLPATSLWNLSISFQGDFTLDVDTGFKPTNPNVLSFNPNGTASGSFTMSFIEMIEPGPLDPIPEPATLAVLGLMGVFGGVAVRRKLRAAA